MSKFSFPDAMLVWAHKAFSQLLSQDEPPLEVKVDMGILTLIISSASLPKRFHTSTIKTAMRKHFQSSVPGFRYVGNRFYFPLDEAKKILGSAVNNSYVFRGLVSACEQAIEERQRKKGPRKVLPKEPCTIKVEYENSTDLEPVCAFLGRGGAMKEIKGLMNKLPGARVAQVLLVPGFTQEQLREELAKQRAAASKEPETAEEAVAPEPEPKPEPEPEPKPEPKKSKKRSRKKARL